MSEQERVDWVLANQQLQEQLPNALAIAILAREVRRLRQELAERD